MATLLELKQKGQLFRLDAALGPAELEERSVYFLPEAAKWMQETLPGLGSTHNIEESPAEQIDALMHIFCAGKSLAIGWQFKLLHPRGNGVWQLKTADIRMFGWFYVKDIFIVSHCGLARHIKEHGLYHGYCSESVRLRTKLDLDEPKFIAGDNPHDVVSNCYQP